MPRDRISSSMSLTKADLQKDLNIFYTFPYKQMQLKDPQTNLSAHKEASVRSHRVQQSLYLIFICVMGPKSLPCYRHSKFQRCKAEVRKKTFCLFNKSLFPDIPTYTGWSRCIVVFPIINQNWEYTLKPHYWLDLERWSFKNLSCVRLRDPAAE